MARVVVGMSGGVDSSVAAAVLQEQGYEVVGATMLVWSPPGVDMGQSDGCCGLDAAADARRVCSRLGIRHYTLDFQERFYDSIVRNYVSEYLAGRTPNPCVLCNEFLKFRALLDRARDLGAAFVATGHYARVLRDEGTGRWRLLRGLDRARDQSYALYRLSQEQLSRALFPLGEMTKAEVRRRAAELELPTAGKPDSQETCFVPNNDYPALIQLLAPDALREGEVCRPDGTVLGRHHGVARFTIGQRKGINVGSPRPLYVSSLDPVSNRVTVVPADDPALFRREVRADQVNLISVTAAELEGGSMKGEAKIRYNSVAQPAELTLIAAGDTPVLQVRFDAPVRAATPGQSLVFYQGDDVVAGGVISG